MGRVGNVDFAPLVDIGKLEIAVDTSIAIEIQLRVSSP